jgi:hypothetical protein
MLDTRLNSGTFLITPWGVQMREAVDTSKVFKRSVACRCCNQAYLFNLRAIANNPELKCPGCGNSIDISDDAYRPLVSQVTAMIAAIECVEGPQ